MKKEISDERGVREEATIEAQLNLVHIEAIKKTKQDSHLDFHFRISIALFFPYLLYL